MKLMVLKKHKSKLDIILFQYCISEFLSVSYIWSSIFFFFFFGSRLIQLQALYSSDEGVKIMDIVVVLMHQARTNPIAPTFTPPLLRFFCLDLSVFGGKKKIIIHLRDASHKAQN